VSKIFKDDVTDEWFYPQDEFILSETDSKGIIIYVNDLFCEVADYKREELIGEPHNILRHKDMPRIAFKGLWDDVQNKGFWTGYVKNIRKDRDFYWVYATVMKREDSNGVITYLSLRVRPNPIKIQEIEKLYAQLRLEE
jgi:PAS domain S-box-containing protein